MTKKSEAQILEDCKRTQGFETDTAFAEALGVSRQNLYQWLNGKGKPSLDVLKLWRLEYVATAPWRNELANQLLQARGFAAPSTLQVTECDHAKEPVEILYFPGETRLLGVPLTKIGLFCNICNRVYEQASPSTVLAEDGKKLLDVVRLPKREVG